MSKYTDAVGVLVSAAEAREAQWQGLVDLKNSPASVDSWDHSPDGLIDELWEVWGEMSENDDDTEAQEQAQMIHAAIVTVALGEDLINTLERAEDMLSDIIQDAQVAAENEPGFISRFSSGTGPICVPEDAAPDEDEARGHIRDAIDLLVAAND
jgi:hypothetical protein